MRVIYFIGFFLLSAALFSCGLDCVDKKTGMHKSSQTINESKQNDVYKFEMSVNQKKYVINNEAQFVIDKAWVENAWFYDCIDNKAVLKKDTFSRLVIDGKYYKRNDTSNYILMESGNRHGSFLGGKLSFNYDNQDTFLLTLQENNTLKVIDTLKLFKIAK